MKRPYLLVVLFLLVFLFQVFVFVYVMNDYDRQRRHFKVTEQTFVEAVERGVSNFMARLTPVDFPEVGAAAPPLDPSIVLVDDFSSWENFSGHAFCMLDGVTYSIGDYSPYGLVTRIAGNRVYCSTSNSVCIVRARSVVRPKAPFGRTAAAPDDGAL